MGRTEAHLYDDDEPTRPASRLREERARVIARFRVIKYKEFLSRASRCGRGRVVRSFKRTNERANRRRIRRARVVFIRVRIRLARRYETSPHTHIDVNCTPLVNTPPHIARHRLCASNVPPERSNRRVELKNLKKSR